MKLPYIFFTAMLLFACGQNHEHTTNIHNDSTTQNSPTSNNSPSVSDKRINFDSVDHKFFLKNIRKIDSTNSFEKYEQKFRKLTLAEYYECFQVPEDKNLTKDAYPDAYFYSNQGTSNGIHRYIFATFADYSRDYMYNSYDKDGKLVSSFEFRSVGGDGGDMFESSSTVLNDSAIQRTSLVCEFKFDDKIPDEENCDSSVTNILLLPDGNYVERIAETYKITKKSPAIE